MAHISLPLLGTHRCRRWAPAQGHPRLGGLVGIRVLPLAAADCSLRDGSERSVRGTLIWFLVVLHRPHWLPPVTSLLGCSGLRRRAQLGTHNGRMRPHKNPCIRNAQARPSLQQSGMLTSPRASTSPRPRRRRRDARRCVAASERVVHQSEVAMACGLEEAGRLIGFYVPLAATASWQTSPRTRAAASPRPAHAPASSRCTHVDRPLPTRSARVALEEDELVAARPARDLRPAPARDPADSTGTDVLFARRAAPTGRRACGWPAFSLIRCT